MLKPVISIAFAFFLLRKKSLTVLGMAIGGCWPCLETVGRLRWLV